MQRAISFNLKVKGLKPDVAESLGIALTKQIAIVAI